MNSDVNCDVNCDVNSDVNCGRCELRCELRPELRPGLRPELRCELRAIWMRREAPQARKILVYWHGNSHGGGSLLLSLPLSLPPSLPLFLCLPPPPSPLPFVPADTAGQLRPPYSVPYTTHRPHSEAWRHWAQHAVLIVGQLVQAIFVTTFCGRLYL